MNKNILFGVPVTMSFYTKLLVYCAWYCGTQN